MAKQLLLNDFKSQQQEKELANARRKAVEQAWKKEKEYIQNGKGTRDWSPEQQKEIIEKGKVRGFEGHHMRSVSSGISYDEQYDIAVDKNNIQFLEKTKENNEHLKAHGGNTRNRTNGYYDVKTDKMKDFGYGKPRPPKAGKLSNPIYEQKNEQMKSRKESENQNEKQEIKYSYTR